MSFKDIDSTTLHFTGKAQAKQPWQDTMDSSVPWRGFGSYAGAALLRMQKEENEAVAEKQKAIADKLARYQAQEEEMEREREIKKQERLKFLQDKHAKIKDGDAALNNSKRKRMKGNDKRDKKGKKDKKDHKKSKAKDKKKKKRKNSPSEASSSTSIDTSDESGVIKKLEEIKKRLNRS
eukprot:gnl/MRDRNA2_/MRDRNA2_201866_c0_seq1.p1 gnl/MRDRNA2_/MRDRNA2_201866_c0~~gnl/MRDRNA2_/MRDRNA2_201866_c0_seq1.p1  ORF type:complete len:179 (-),score=62.95 gnl/MRDRNA2_/MRDRNA2_201866_c0_seq1:120-656(-)